MSVSITIMTSFNLTNKQWLYQTTQTPSDSDYHTDLPSYSDYHSEPSGDSHYQTVRNYHSPTEVPRDIDSSIEIPRLTSDTTMEIPSDDTCP